MVIKNPIVYVVNGSILAWDRENQHGLNTAQLAKSQNFNKV